VLAAAAPAKTVVEFAAVVEGKATADEVTRVLAGAVVDTGAVEAEVAGDVDELVVAPGVTTVTP
jgi:hypothetical protein